MGRGITTGPNAQVAVHIASKQQNRHPLKLLQLFLILSVRLQLSNSNEQFVMDFKGLTFLIILMRSKHLQLLLNFGI